MAYRLAPCPGSGLIVNSSQGRARCPYCGKRRRVRVGGKIHQHSVRVEKISEVLEGEIVDPYSIHRAMERYERG